MYFNTIKGVFNFNDIKRINAVHLASIIVIHAKKIVTGDGFGRVQ